MLKNPTLVRRILIVFYLASWVSFGFLYQWLANATDGAAFIFNEDLKVAGQVDAFKRATVPLDEGIIDRTGHFRRPEERHAVSLRPGGSAVEDAVVRLILKAGDTRRLAQKYNEQVFSDRPMGPNWAAFYAERFRRDGMTHFYAQVVDRSKPPVVVIFGTIFPMPEIEFYKVTLRLVHTTYTFVGRNLPSRTDEAVVATYVIWTDRPPRTVMINERPIVAMPGPLLPDFLEHSYTYFDSSLLTLQEIERGQFNYPLWDFLYFSAVTITTVGYGDILPGSTNTRIIVMVEAMLGVLLGGMFVSSLFWHPKKTNDDIRRGCDPA